jgi:rhodanese-related sulfurtransferase
MAGWFRRFFDALASVATVVGAVACAASSEIHELPAGALIVDVRTAAEYQSGHFPDAINLPVGEIAKRTSELGDASRPIVVYCRSGHRSAAAKALLEKAGFTNVTDGGPLSAMMRLAPEN